MLRTRVIPCLTVEDGRLVKTVKFRKPAYVGDPVNAIKIYNEKEVDELVLLDIRASVEGHPPDLELVAHVADECFMPLAYGGGISRLEEIRKLFELGIEKVIVNTSFARNPDLVREAAETFGSQSVMVGIDVQRSIMGKYTVRTESGRASQKTDPVTWARRAESLGAGEILLTAIDRDGTWSGYDVGLIRKVTEAVGVPVIACGGAASMEDFGRAVGDGGASAVAAGSMVVYQGPGLGVLINFPTPDELAEVLD
jgi:cyclase